MKCLVATSFLLAGTLTASACHEFDRFLELTVPDPTAPKAFLDIGPMAVSRPFDLKMKVCGPQVPDPREVSFDATMPAHKHGMNYVVEVGRLSDGTYLMPNVVLHMPGVWRLEVTVRSSGVSRTYSAEVELE